MKVHLIKEKTILKYAETQARTKSSFDEWMSKISDADWGLPNDIGETFGSADLLGNGSERVVFNIAGNNYRMICKYTFGNRNIRLFVCWIGTHAEYAKLCDKEEQYTIWIF